MSFDFSYNLRHFKGHPLRDEKIRFFDTILTLEQRDIKSRRAIYMLKMSRPKSLRQHRMKRTIVSDPSTTHVCDIATEESARGQSLPRKWHKVRGNTRRALFRLSDPLTSGNQPFAGIVHKVSTPNV